jgi:hypothetical protein
MDERALYDTVWELSSRSHERAGAEGIVGVTEDHWPEIQERRTDPEDAEPVV